MFDNLQGDYKGITALQDDVLKLIERLGITNYGYTISYREYDGLLYYSVLIDGTVGMWLWKRRVVGKSSRSYAIGYDRGSFCFLQEGYKKSTSDD